MIINVFSSLGPLSTTTNDFWRMVWEQRSPVIVMITRLKESKKVMQYFVVNNPFHYIYYYCMINYISFTAE